MKDKYQKSKMRISKFCLMIGNMKLNKISVTRYTINRKYIFIHKSFFKLQDIMQHTNRRLQLHIVFQMESSASPLPAFCFLWCVLTPCEEKPISHLIERIQHDCRYAINLVNIMCQKKNYVQLREYIIGSIKFIPCHSATPKITINP